MKKIFLDNNSTTPVDPRVLEKMIPYFVGEFGNPSSNHPYGWAAQSAVEQARSNVALALGAQAKNIFFTSGATESNNMALLGLAYKIKKETPNFKAHFITSKVEHHSVLEPMEFIRDELGFDVSFIDVTSEGVVDVSEVAKHICSNTVLMSFIWANNEIGSINPMKELAQLARQNNILLHTDATQSFGKLDSVNLNEVDFDLLSISAHKIYGPKGVGALYVGPRVRGLHPLVWGGGHERGLRAGTLNVPGIMGLGEACQIIDFDEQKQLHRMTQKFFVEFQNQFKNHSSPIKIKLNGPDFSQRLPGQLNIQFEGVRMDQMIHRMSAISMSTTSACGSNEGKIASSHVLKAIGLSEQQTQSSVRMGLGRFTTAADLEFALDLFLKTIYI